MLPPRLMFTATTLNAGAMAYTRSRPAMMSDVNAPMQGAVPPQLTALVTSENTWTAISSRVRRDSRKRDVSISAVPAAMPATCVP